MAYRADIEIGVKGASKLKELQDRITRLSRSVEDFNVQTLIDRKAVQSLDTYTQAVSKASSNLREVTIRLDAAGKASGDYAEAISQYVTALGQSNAAQRLTNDLIADEIELRRKQKLAASGIAERTQYAGPIGPGQASAVGTLAGQKSPVAERISRTLQSRQDEFALQQALLRLEEKSATELNKKVQSQQELVKGTAEVLALLEQQAKRQQFLAGKSGAAQGPLAPAGSMGFPVALPLLKAEKQNLAIAAKEQQILAKKQQILDRTVKTRQELNGLAAQLQRLDTNSAVAIADADRAQQKLNASKLKELEISKQGALLAGKFSPIQGSTSLPGSPAFLKAQQKARREQISNAALGAGFPLLFGGGPGAVLGGAAGGLVPGPGAFAAQIALSAVGQQIDTFVASIAKLGQALNPVTADLEAITTAAGLSGTATQKYILDLDAADKSTEALAAATQQLALVVGNEGVNALRDFGDQTQELTNQWNVLITQISAGLAQLLSGPVAALIRSIETTSAINIARTSSDPRLKQLSGELGKQGPPLMIGGTVFNAQDRLRIEEQIVERVREIRQEQEKTLNPAEAVLSARQADLNVLNAQLDLARTNGDITDNNVYQLERKLIIQQTYAKLQDAINKKQETESILLAEQVALAQLASRRSAALAQAGIASAREREREMERAARERRQVAQLQAQVNLSNTLLNIDKQLVIATADELDDKVKQLKIDRVLAETNGKIAEIKAQELPKAQELLRIQLAENDGESRLLKLDLERAVEQNKKLELFKDVLAGLEYEIQYEAAVTQEKREQLELEEAIRKARKQGFTPEEVDQIAEQTKRRQAQQRPLQKYMTDLEKSLNDTEGKVVQLAQTIENELSGAMSSAITGIITGTTTVEEAFSQMFLNIGKAFIDMATQMLAQQLILSILKGFMGGGANMGGSGYFDPMTGKGVAGPNFGFAKGGYPPVGQASLVGENGPELFVPGRQGAIVPNDIFAATRAALNKGDTSGTGAFEENAQALAVSTSYTRERVMEKDRQTMLTGAGGSMLIQTEVINNVEYATVDQVAQIAATSAKQARAQVFADMRNKPSTRASLGMR